MPGYSDFERRRRSAGGRRRVVEIVQQRRAGDQHVDRFGVTDVGELRHLCGAQREHRVVAGRTGIEELRGLEAGEIPLVAVGRGAGREVAHQRLGIERQQHRHGASRDAGQALRHRGVEPRERARHRPACAAARLPGRHGERRGTQLRNLRQRGQRGRPVDLGRRDLRQPHLVTRLPPRLLRCLLQRFLKRLLRRVRWGRILSGTRGDGQTGQNTREQRKS